MPPQDPHHANKRGNLRVPVGIPVEIVHMGETSTGLMCDVSNGGARIEEASRTVPQGSMVYLQMRLAGARIHVTGRVVRRLRNGFCVHFESVDNRLFELLEVSIRRLGPLSDDLED